jgi:hypothetical protein
MSFRRIGILMTISLILIGSGANSMADLPANLPLGPVGTTINLFLSDPANPGHPMAQGSGMFWNLKGSGGAFQPENSSGMVYFSWNPGTYIIDTVNTATDNQAQSDRLSYTIVMGDNGPVSVSGPDSEIKPNAQGIYVVTSAIPQAPDPIDPNNPWQQIQNVPLTRAGHMLLMYDGSVLFHEEGAQQTGTSDWWKLQPDSYGSYLNGAWTRLASTPASYSPANLASGILPDGRVILEGGDMNGSSTWVGLNTGEIYDPVANSWTAVAPPNQGAGEFSSIADAPSVVLANGSYMFGPSGNGDRGAKDQKDVAIFNAHNSTWGIVSGPTRKSANPETAFTLLPNDQILCISTVIGTFGDKSADLYNPTTQSWSPTGSIPFSLLNPLTADGGPIAEIGPSIVMPNGKLVAEGSNTHTAIYDSASNTWSAGPDFPVIGGIAYAADDAPSAILPDGRVLMELSPTDRTGHAMAPTHLFAFDGSTFTQIENPNNSNLSGVPAFVGGLLPLPSGQIMMTDRTSGAIYIYSSPSKASLSWLPAISTVDKNIAPGSSYSLSGTQLSGLTNGAAYGDDWNPNTNYPLVQITNNVSGEVRYARTYNVTSYSIAPGAPGSMSFQLPSDIKLGASMLRVVASGFSSAPVSVNVSNGPALSTPTITPEPSVRPSPAASALPAKKTVMKTIICINKNTTRKISGLLPKCPVGFKPKK